MIKYEKIIASPKVGVILIRVRRNSRWYDEVEISSLDEKQQTFTTIYKSPQFSPFTSMFTILMVKLAELIVT